jgi:peptide/nickel transport system substrate-binding protein
MNKQSYGATVDLLMKGFEAGYISRRRIMELAVKIPALAAALAAAGHLRSASAAGVTPSVKGISYRAQEGGGELTYAFERIVSDTLNQHRSNDTISRQIARHVLDNLVAVNPEDGSIHPWLAESWEISEDGLTYTFTLRQDVTFHDGTPFNAEAVKRNFDETMDPEKTPGFAYTALGSTAYVGTEVVDEFTVKVTFNKPFAAFLLYLSDGGTGIDSPTALDAGGEDYGITSLVGSGPFKFVEWIQTDSVTLEKNPDYNWSSPAFPHTGPTPLDRLIFREVPESSVRAQAVIQGEIDMARIVEPSVPELEGQSGVSVRATPKAGSTRMYLMNTAKAPTDDINVRRAINMAVDKEAMLQLPGWAGFGRPALAPMPSNMVPNGDLSSLEQYAIPYDPEGAIALLEENGWVLNGDIREKDGVQLVLDMVTTTIDVDNGQIEPLDGFLNEIGARLNIRSGDFNFWIDTVQSEDFHMTLMSDSGYIAVGIIQEFFREGEPFANYGLANPDLNAAIDAAVSSTNLDEQWAHLFEAMALVLQEVVGVMGWEQDYLDAVSDRVQNVLFNEVGFPYFYGASLSE